MKKHLLCCQKTLHRPAVPKPVFTEDRGKSGAKLFNRTPSGLTLTYAGERCYQMACQVLKIYSDFEAEISDINQLKPDVS